jgi:hypothetical protein
VAEESTAWQAGSDLGNASTTSATAELYMGLPASLVLTLPPLAGLIPAPV